MSLSRPTACHVVELADGWAFLQSLATAPPFWPPQPDAAHTPVLPIMNYGVSWLLRDYISTAVTPS